MNALLKSWLPLVKPLLRSVLQLDTAPLRNAQKLMRLRQEFGLIEVPDFQ